MSLIKKADLALVLGASEERIEVAELGGEVVVRALTLGEAMAAQIAGEQSSGDVIAETLARAVLCEGDDGDLVPVMTADEWQRWGGHNLPVAIDLFTRQRSLSGGSVEDAEKKSTSSPD